MGATSEFDGRRVISAAGLEEFGVVLDDHAAAGARRGDDEIKALEGGDHVAGDGSGIRPVAGVEGGLAAARLGLGHLHRAAGILQQLHRGKAHGGAEQVDEAGDEQAYAGGGFRHGTSGSGGDRVLPVPVRPCKGFPCHILVLR